jgi:hypothetical protein
VVDSELRSRLQTAGAVVIEGPKACGKTETARQVAASSILLDVDSSARQALAIDPSLVLAGATPRLLDEWQIEPALWNHVRRVVDQRQSPGQFVLTGSSVPADDADRHTGAGRFSFLRMRPMSLFETGHSTGEISFAALMRGEPARATDSGLHVHEFAERITSGGWPALQGLTTTQAARAMRDYIEQVRRVDAVRVAGNRRDAAKLGRLLQSLARNTATEVAVSVLAADAGGADGTLSRNTVADYLAVLQRLMITEDQPAWAPHLRSKAILRSASKRHFVDPALAVAALGAGPGRLMQDLNLLGLLFESLVVRDLRVYAQSGEGQIFHYRDNTGLEVDTIVQLADGRWGAFEIKLGIAAIDSAAETLRRFAGLVDTSRCGEPVALGVITGGGFGYRREDGVDVIPIVALGP